MTQQQGITEFTQIQPNQQNKVDSLALYTFLGIKTPHTKWFRRIVEDYGFAEEKDFWTKMSESSGGRRGFSFDVSIGMAKEACMTAKGDVGKRVRKYYMDLERSLMQPRSVTTGEETAKFFNNLLDEVSKYSPTARVTVAAQISDKVFGIKLPYHALPLVTESRKSATDMANELGVSAIRVGEIVNELNLRVPPYVEYRLSKALYANKEVSMAYYNLDAQRKISEYIKNEKETHHN
jgi:phage anti-repressor protein/plasmid maintenance system antidote protein VapI